jgi:hypothetical protein
MYQINDDETSTYRGEYVDGIPESIFDLSDSHVGDEFPEYKYFVDGELRSFRVRGESGRIFAVLRSDSVLSITDTVKDAYGKDEEFTFGVSVLQHLMTIGKIQNRGWEGDRNKAHPDLHPAKTLVARVLQYFKQNGHDVDMISGQWYKDHPILRDNQDAYERALLAIQQYHHRADKPVRGRDQEEAAKQTPAGKMRISLGYDVIASLTEDDTTMTLIMRKSQPSEKV